MSLLVVIQAHGKAQAIFDRHLPLWLHHNVPILVQCPEDDPVITALPKIAVGKSSHDGPFSYDRMVALLDALLETPADSFMVCEYDSFCLSRTLRILPGVLAGNMWDDFDPPGYWGSNRYPNPPWLFDRQVARDLKLAAASSPSIEGGHADRLLAYWAKRAQIPLVALGSLGYSEFTIGPDKQTPCLEAVRNGARFIHGVKSEQLLKCIYDATSGIRAKGANPLAPIFPELPARLIAAS